VFQSYALYPHMTVAENMAYGLTLAKRPKDEITRRVNEAASILQLTQLQDRKPAMLSGGQRQRVAIGRAFVKEPALFLFDEPLSNLDAQLRMELRAEIKSVHQQFRTTTVYVTHDQVEAMTLADNIVVMKDGYIVQQGSPLSIYDQPANTFVARFIGSPPMNLLEGQFLQRNGTPGVSCGELWLPLPEKWWPQAQQAAGQAVTVGLRPHDIRIVDSSHQPAAQLRLLEVTGESSLLHITWSGFAMHVQCAGRANVSADKPVWLEANSANIHLFDAQSGLRLQSA